MKMIMLMKKAKAAMALNSEEGAKANNRAAPFMVAAGIGLLALTPELALAAPWDSAATKVLEIFTGGLTRTLAIIAVIASGIAAIAGKLSWDWAIKIIVGIVLIFGSTAIVDYFVSATSA